MNLLRVGAQALVVMVVLAAGALAQDSIGSITQGSGEIVVLRAAGGEEPAGVGTAIFQQDQIYVGEGGAATITFVDQTILTLGANSALTIDDMVYDPASQANTGLLSLVGGTMGLISGAIVASGDMTVTTPVSTIGIRGTAVLIDSGFTVTQNADGGFTVTASGTGGETISLVLSPDGRTGVIVVTNNQTSVTTEAEAIGDTVFTDVDGESTFTTLTAEELMAAYGAVLQALNNAAGLDLTDPANAAEAAAVEQAINDLLQTLTDENEVEEDEGSAD